MLYIIFRRGIRWILLGAAHVALLPFLSFSYGEKCQLHARSLKLLGLLMMNI